MSSDSAARPPLVTFVGSAAIVGSLLSLITAFTTISQLHTLAFRQSLEARLGDRLTNAGIGVDDLTVMVRVLTIVGALAAIPVIVWSWELMQRNPRSLPWLSGFAAVMAVAGIMTDEVWSLMVGVVVSMAWWAPSRAWLVGENAARGGTSGAGSRLDAWNAGQTSVTDPPVGDRATGWRPSRSSQAAGDRGGGTGVRGDRPDDQTGDPAGDPTGDRIGTPPAHLGAAVDREGLLDRPPQVRTVALLTWGFGGLTILEVIIDAVLFVRGAEATLEAAARNPDAPFGAMVPPLDVYLAVGLVGFTALIVWALAAMVVAWVMLRRHEWARIVLLISASLATAAAAFAVLGSRVEAVPVLIACAVSIQLLTRGDVRRWFAQGGPRDPGSVPPAGPTWTPPPGGSAPPR